MGSPSSTITFEWPRLRSGLSNVKTSAWLQVAPRRTFRGGRRFAFRDGLSARLQTMGRVAVTGGAGFIGSHLVDRLLADGHRVLAIDNFSNGGPRNLVQHQGNSDLELMELDVRDLKSAHLDGVQWLFHLAALADIVPSIEEPLSYYEANVTGTARTLEACRGASIERFVYAASSSCYGIPDQYPTPEDAPARPQYPYALTKYLAEETVMHWQQVYGLPALSLRFFNVYGPRSRTTGTYGAVFGVFLAQLLAGKPLTIVGDGTQTRDFTYVTDIVDALVTAARSDVVGERINIGSGNPQSVLRLADLLAGERVHIPKRPGEPDCTQADTAKAKSLLAWESQVEFAEGVALMLENIEYWRDAPVWTPDGISEATRSWFETLS